MKKTTLTHSLWVALFAVFFEIGSILAHAEDGMATNKAQKVIGPEADGFQLTISTTNDVFQIGQEIDLGVEIKNVSTNTRAIKLQDGLMNYTFHILGPNGTQAVPTELGKWVLHPVACYHQSEENLGPGQSFGPPIPLNQMFVMTNAGEYTIQVWRDTYHKAVSAGPLKIRLVAPKLH